jgi:hypothetical protein
MRSAAIAHDLTGAAEVAGDPFPLPSGDDGYLRPFEADA